MEPDPWDVVRAHAVEAVGWVPGIDGLGAAWVRGSARVEAQPDPTDWSATASDVHQLLAAAVEAGWRVQVDVEAVGIVVVRLVGSDGPGPRWAGATVQSTLAWALAAQAGLVDEGEAKADEDAQP
jgi:hypothetical protein